MIPRIKTLFKTPFDPYESIIVQNIIKGSSFALCYEVALEIQKKTGTPKEYIEKLKQSFTEAEWAIVKKLHKKGNQAEKLANLKQGKEESVGGKRQEPEVKKTDKT